MRPDAGASSKTAHATSTADLLRRAAARVRRGWTQGAFARCSPNGNGTESSNPRAVVWCALGAIGKESTLAPFADSGEAIEALHEHIQREPWSWNDEPGQTAENVASTMERCAATLGGAT